MASFYADFAACYGTFWLVLLVAAVVSQSNIDTGMFGLIGFPLIALIYAAIRRPDRLATERRNEELRARVIALEARIAESRG